MMEDQWLEQVISLAKDQLNQAMLKNEDNSSSIISLKQEMRDNTSHSISGLYDSQNFEDLVELSQYINPITNKIAEYDAMASKIEALKRLIESPYFARIDFKYDDEESFEKIYIGRSSLMKEDSYEMVVYDWRSPIASVFYRFGIGQAFYEAPDGRITGEVNLKRQYEIKKGKLEYYFDADVQIMDEFLRKMLSQNTSPKMKTIVETIQKEQDTVIRDMENDLMMVQGVAGSGKTSIALHRAAYLMYQGLSSRLSAYNIMIISPNSLFEQYISNVLPELGEENVVSVVFEELLAEILQGKHLQTRNQFLESLISSSACEDIMKSSIEFKTSQQFMEILDRFICDLPHRWIDFSDIYSGGECVVSKEALKDKLLTARKETPLGLKLKQLEDFIFESFREAGKNRSNKSVKNEIRKFTEISVESLYRELFNNKEYFYSIATDIALPECIDDIISFTHDNLNTDRLFYDDASAIAYLTLKINGVSDKRNIKQVVIDEAQDYYPLHYEILNLLFPDSKYTVLGDINQTLEKQEDLSLYNQISKTLNKKKSILVTMDKSFRCTNEILNYSSRFILSSGEIKSFNRKGDEPAVYKAVDQASLNDMIVSEINSCIDQGYQSIGLICKSEQNAGSLFACLKGKVNVQLIKSNSSADLHGTLVMPVYMSKGLELDAVLVCDCDNENYHSEDDKKLLYIACTRALHRLSLFYKGEASPLL